MEVAGIISELYDVAVLPGVRRPMALGFKSDEISRFVTIEYPNAPPVFQPFKAAPAAQTAPRQPAAAPGYRFQMSVDMTVTAVLQQYHPLTFPPLAEQLRGRSLREPLVTAVARVGDEPIAMALAEIAPDNAGAHLLSCFVATAHRRHGIATRLLAHLQQALAQRGLRYLDLSYSTDWPSLPVVEHFLARYGWLPPQTLLYQYKVTYDIGSAAWLHDAPPLPDGCELFPWSDLQPAKHQSIQRKLKTGECPANLDPFQADAHLAFNSVVLRHGGDVAGWMVTHQAATDAIQYTSFFLRPDLQRQGLGLALLAAAIRPQVDSDVPYGIWQVAASNEPMLAFVRRYLQPYAMKQTERRVARQVLGGE
ncbi:MAG: GNAT family N-acetyltransferase [Anaerolinea sp.]|nr:GNAT family N-acetyltransferase [Anaerolinea sp.]